MPGESNALEDTFLVICARELLYKDPYKNLKDLGRAIMEANPSANRDAVEKAVKRQHFDNDHAAGIAQGAAELLAKHFEQVSKSLAATSDEETLDYLRAILARRVSGFTLLPEPSETSTAAEIFSNWSQFSRKASDVDGRLLEVLQIADVPMPMPSISGFLLACYPCAGPH